MTDKVRVALVFGGRSSEHSISCATAGGVLSAIDRDRFDVIPVGVTQDGMFVLEADDPERFRLNSSAMPVVVDNGSRVHFPEGGATRELTVTDAEGQVASLGDIDIVFPILHGPFGEDGTVQGMFELFNLPYVGNGVLASALGMDKHFTKTVLAAVGIRVAPWVTITASEWMREREPWRERAHALGLPIFVKPARAGSSVGVSRVDRREDLDAALELAFAEDTKVLIESMVVGREIECGVLSGRDGSETRVSAAGEVIISDGGFYDYASKYLDGPGITLVCPAELTAHEYEELRRTATLAFDSIGGSGLARIDFFLTSEGFVLNEINTMPGFTPISMFPRCWMQSGFTYRGLITELIELGLTAER